MGVFDDIRDKVMSFRKGISNLFYFFNVIWQYRDFDYGFMLSIEKRIMQSMQKYFETSNIAEGNDETARELKLCLSVLDEMEKCTEYWYAEEKEGHKPIKVINTNNAPDKIKELIKDKDTPHNRAFQYDWYEYKCWRLYNLIRCHKMKTWWD